MTTSEARRFWAKVEKTDGCWLWLAHRVRGGYGRVWFRGGRLMAHRLAWVAENGPIPDGLSILHECDTPACVRTSHMRLGTPADNTADSHSKGRRSYQRGTMPRGEAHRGAKLTSVAVAEIRAARRDGETTQSIGDRFGISRVQASRVARGVSWAWTR